MLPCVNEAGGGHLTRKRGSFATVSLSTERKKRGSEKRVSKQRRYAVSKQRTMVSGLAAVYLLLSALTESERVGERCMCVFVCA